MKQAIQSLLKKPRLFSLDFFRGATVAAMILVNDPGDWGNIYSPLEHSKWNGCTPTDLVFPFFLFIVGVSIVYAMQAKKNDVANHKKIISNVIRRSLIIIALGICLPLIGNFEFAHLRIPGVLQRIGLVFGITAIIFLKTNTRTQIIIAASCLIGYYLMMNFIPVPGFGAANLEPSTNLGAWVDMHVFTENHVWQQSKTFDPEGLLGTIPAVAHCLIGVLIGTNLKRDAIKNNKQILQLIGAGILLIIGGLIWNAFFPINKALWTSSFVLFTTGLATIILLISYWIIDVKGYKKFIPPFLAFGQNAIAAYVLADFIPEILSVIPATYHGQKTNIWSWMYSTFMTPYLSPKNASLAAAILTVIIIFIPVWILYKKKIIVKI